jgi:hypothetical protein
MFLSKIAIEQDTLPILRPKIGLILGSSVNFYNFKKLNNYFNSNSISEIENTPDYYSIGFTIRDKSQSSYIVINGGYFSSSKVNKSNSANNSYFKSWYVESSVNYNILNSFTTLICPNISFGYKENALIISKVTRDHMYLMIMFKIQIIQFYLSLIGSHISI